MTPPNPDPLEAKIEKPFLDRILLIDTEKNILGGESDRNAFVLLGTPKEMMDELLTLLQQEKKEAERLGRIDEVRSIKNGFDEYKSNGFETNQTIDELTDQMVARLDELKKEK